MNPSDAAPDSIEVGEAREIVADEDVLSHDLARELETLGTAIGVVAVVALVCGHLARAARTVAAIKAPAAPTPTNGAAHG